MQAIIIETGSYNAKRYGKPWIARLDFSTSKAGELSLDVEIGDVVAAGQKDHRNSRHSAPNYSYINESGKRIRCDTKMEAVRAHRKIMAEKAEKPVPVDTSVAVEIDVEAFA